MEYYCLGTGLSWHSRRMLHNVSSTWEKTKTQSTLLLNVYQSYVPGEKHVSCHTTVSQCHEWWVLEGSQMGLQQPTSSITSNPCPEFPTGFPPPFKMFYVCIIKIQPLSLFEFLPRTIWPLASLNFLSLEWGFMLESLYNEWIVYKDRSKIETQSLEKTSNQR